MSEINKRAINVLFGSQTGTSEEIAESLARHAFRLHFQIELSVLDEVDINKLLTSSLILFVVSTTGQGDPPDNMLKFWRFIMRKQLPQDLLLGVHYSVIALGDSSYQKFNFVGKKLFNRLKQLSAIPLVPLILGDEQHELGHDAALDQHLPALWDKVLQISPLPANKSMIGSAEILPPKFKIINTDEPAVHDLPYVIPASNTNPYPSRLISSERVTTSTHFQDTRLVKLAIDGSGIKYKPGDVTYIRPHNSEESVNEFLSLLGLDGEQRVRITPFSANSKLPKRLEGITTWRKLATEYLDITAVPRRYFFELMSKFARDEMEKEKLAEFASAEGQDERYTYTTRVKRTTLEVLSDFRHTTPLIPVNYIFDLFTPLQPRAFSIASSQVVESDHIELLVAVVTFKTKLVKPRLGVCSNWLASLHPGSTVSMWVHPGTFRFPQHDEPCILIGPGTGVAPLRSFILERVSKGFTNNMLIFGCRHREADFYFGDQWTEMQQQNQLVLLTAFSQDQEEKYYVWNAIKDHSDLIWDWIHNQNAYIFIAGNAKRMPDDVRATLMTVASNHLTADNTDPEEYICSLEKSGRYQLECWS